MAKKADKLLTAKFEYADPLVATSSVVVVADDDGMLWRIDVEMGTAKRVKHG